MFGWKKLRPASLRVLHTNRSERESDVKVGIKTSKFAFPFVSAVV